APSGVYSSEGKPTDLELLSNRRCGPGRGDREVAPAISGGRLEPRGNVRFTAALDAKSAAVGRLQLREPTSFAEPGNYRLTCLGSIPAGAAVAGIKAADDGSFLDGDYDGQPGGNFTLEFTVA